MMDLIPAASLNARLSLALLVLVGTSCSLKARAVNTLSEVLAESEVVYLSDEDPELVAEATDSLEGRMVIKRHMCSARVKFEGSVDDVSAGPFFARRRDVPEERHLRREGGRNTMSEPEGQRYGTHVL